MPNGSVRSLDFESGLGCMANYISLATFSFPLLTQERKTHFLKGVVTGREWLRFGFITNGFNLICGPSEVRFGRLLMGGGGPAIREGAAVAGGDETGTGVG